MKKDCGKSLTLNEMQLKEFSLFNVYLISAGQVQGLDTHRATNEQVQNRPQKKTEKLKTSSKSTKTSRKRF